MSKTHKDRENKDLNIKHKEQKTRRKIKVKDLDHILENEDALEYFEKFHNKGSK